jgi:hypothetical protein
MKDQRLLELIGQHQQIQDLSSRAILRVDKELEDKTVDHYGIVLAIGATTKEIEAIQRVCDYLLTGGGTFRYSKLYRSYQKLIRLLNERTGTLHKLCVYTAQEELNG